LDTGQTATGNIRFAFHETETGGEAGQIVLDVVTSGPFMIKASDGRVVWIEAGRTGFHVVLDAETFEVISEETVFQTGHKEAGEALDALCEALSSNQQ
jgi:hypothetical protein